MIKVSVCFLLGMNLIPFARGQTSLNPGEVILVTVNADGDKNFDFVPLVDLEKGTVIKFSDDAWIADSNSWRGSEGTLTYTTPQAITAGTIISCPSKDGGENFTKTGSFNPSGSGDNIIVYQGEESDPSFIYGVGWARNENWTFDPANASNTSDPLPGLNSSENTLIHLGSSDNYQYQISNGFSGTKTALLALVADVANWSSHNSTPFEALSGSFTIIIPSNPIQLVITSINNDTNPTAGVPFSIEIQTLDSNQVAQPVTSNTWINISLAVGNGALTGATTGLITAGTHAVTISNLSYDRAEGGVKLKASRVSGDELTSDTSDPFRVLQKLNPGAIAITGFAFDDPDEFAFVPLIDILPETKISFTDQGWKSDNSFRGGENTVTWTASDSGVTAGKVIWISSDSVNTNSGTIAGSLTGLSTSGDQILAYQGVDTTFIYALNSAGDAWQEEATSTNTSALPRGLINGTHAIALPEKDNGYYQGSTTGTRKALLPRIGNPVHWSTSDSRENHDPSENSPASFTILPLDTIPPDLGDSNPLSPPDEATSVALDASLGITFSETIVPGNGAITIHTFGGAIFEEVLVTSERVTISGSAVAIDPAAEFAGETRYYVLIDSAAFLDEPGNPFPGIRDTTTWNFTTKSIITPTVQIGSPAGTATNTAPIPITVTFSKAITGFDSTDIQISNGIAQDFSGSGSDYQLNIQPSDEGPVILTVDSAAAQDIDGNWNRAATPFNITYDTTAPAILNVYRDKAVPLTSETTTISAVIKDNHAVDTVLIYYTIGSGSTLTFPMDYSDDSTWTGSMPAFTDSSGKVLVYWIVARDRAGNLAESGQTHLLIGITAIGSTRQNSADGLAKFKGFAARVSGTATVSDSVFSTADLDVFIQDETGGINVYKSGIKAEIRAGNAYTAIGEIDQLNGLTRIVPWDVATDILDQGKSSTPGPVSDLSITNLLQDQETFEGRLVRIVGATIISGSWPNTNSGGDLLASDDGAATLTLRIKPSTGSHSEPSGPFTVTGILSQEDTSAPFLDGYHLLPRSPSDISLDNRRLVRINEIMYNPATDCGDWIELTYGGPDSMDLKGWILEGDGQRFIIPDNNPLKRGEFLVLVEDTTLFELQYPGITPCRGNLNFDLPDDGGGLILYDPGGSLADSVFYGVAESWPGAPNGNGPSLELIHPGLEGSEVTNWRASSHNGGTPAAPNTTTYPLFAITETDTLEYHRETEPQTILPGLTVQRLYPGDTTLIAATVNISGRYQPGEDSLEFSTAGGITAGWTAKEPGQGLVTFSGSASFTDYSRVLSSLQYRNRSQVPILGMLRFGLTVSDSLVTSDTLVRVLAISNAPPQEFTLLSPNDNLNLDLEELKTSGDPLGFYWSRALDDDGDMVRYWFQARVTNADPLPVNTDTLRHEHTTSDTFNQITIAAILEDLELLRAESLALEWIVSARDPYAEIPAGNGPFLLILDGTALRVNPDLPQEFALYQNHPNPFNSRTVLTYDIPEFCWVRIVIYNLLGQRVRRMEHGLQPPGRHHIIWKGRDDSGVPLPSGIFLVKISAEPVNRITGFGEVMKVVLLK